MTPLELRLVNDNQRGFPLCHAPFAQLARRYDIEVDLLLWIAEDLVRRGVVSRVGPVFAPHAVGASTLAALPVPPARVQEVAALISSYAAVNHNYLRDHPVNLWFVATAADDAELDAVLDDIEGRAHCGPLLRCPLVEEYRIDLGFDLTGTPAPRNFCTYVNRPLTLSETQHQVLHALQAGLPLVQHPYEAVAQWSGLSEAALLDLMRNWVETGVIRRLGFVARHHELGYRANAMVVWQVPPELACTFGHRLREAPEVTLCYQRRPAPPRWPYNLYCMIHGRERAPIQRRIEALTHSAGLVGFAREVLFSTARFKQQGARYPAALPVPHG